VRDAPGPADAAQTQGAATFRVEWIRRTAPLPPVGAAARGPAAAALVRRLLALSDEALAGLAGVASPDLVAVGGPQDSLPWVDGVLYLGAAPGAAGLWVPTTLAPTVPEPLLARAIQHARIASPAAVLVFPGGDATVISLAAARPVARDLLEGWLEARP
jgi:hypothetical protein